MATTATLDSQLAGGQAIFKILKFTSVTDGLTYEITNPAPKAFWAQVATDPSTNTSAGINVTWDSTNGYTFYPGVDTVTVYLFIVE